MRHILPALLALATTAVAAQTPQPPDVMVDTTTRARVIDDALQALTEAYVFPAVAQKMTDAIRARQTRNEYDAVTSGRQLAQMLTDHLREVSHDLHLAVYLAPPPPPPPAPPPAGARTLDEGQRIIFGRQNFGFARLERLAGNIGYLDLRGFMPPAYAGETATAAMTFLASSDAIIFDLRQNGGGDPSMVAFITSYLFGSTRVHLNDFYTRRTNETRSSWTLEYVPGRRLTDKDVYILTSARTFSGAEEFTYNLKHLERATIVGETTAGAAHLVESRRLPMLFMISIPSGRPINPITKSNWEGVGIEPDVRVPAEHALKAAHLLALQKQQQRLGPDAPWLRNEVATALPGLRKELGELTAAIVAAGGAPPVSAANASDDFESGTLAAWRTDRRGAGGWFTYRDGKTPPEPPHSDPNFPFDVPNPPQGTFAAVVDANGPGRRILYRDVTLDGRYRLRLTIFYVNHGRFSEAPVSSRNAISDEQQFRIDIIAASAPVDSVANDHVLLSVFQAKPNDPPRREPMAIAVDLSPWAGQAVRLRFAAADNQAPLRAGVDDVRFERIER